MLRLDNVEVIYNNVILVLRGVSMQLDDGKIVALLGANGAGKSTTLKAISGLLKTELGQVTHGSVEFDGNKIHNLSPQKIAAMGITQVIEGRRLYQHLTGEENLMAGAYLNRNRVDVKKRTEQVYTYFSRLKDVRQNIAGYLSGGEQQMLVIGCSLMAKPKVMLLDEPSLGLAPLVVREISDIVMRINAEEKVSVLLVEQNARVALSLAEYGYVMENGRIVLDGPSEKLRDNEDVREFYLGLSKLGGKKSFREVKHYKRRKRWLG